MSNDDTKVHPTIFREYIGVQSFPDFKDFPEQMINPKINEFHFILGFATEEYDETTKTGTGNFSVGWDLTVFSPEKAKQLKHKYPNVKVVFSIGGRGRDGQYPTFNTALKEDWLENAERSLKNIIADFNNYCGCNLIDGIDVNYEKIDSSEQVFVESIGKLIKNLKEHSDGVVKVASIAPSQSVNHYYKQLYKYYHNYIDWVDYQLYDQPVSKSQELVAIYNALSTDYRHDKNLLVGFSTDPADAGKIDPQEFVNGCRSLLKSELLPGIFVWDADDSWDQAKGNDFQIEGILQKLLLEYAPGGRRDQE